MYQTPKLDKYETWLKDEGYQESTILVTLRHIKAVYAHRDKDVAKTRAAHVRRYLRFVAKTRKNPLGRKFVQRMLGLGLEAAVDSPNHGKRSKTNLTDDQWLDLRAKLRRGDDTSRLLIAYMESPYRIGEFLNLRIGQLVDDDVQDKISRAWITDKKLGARARLFQVLCKTERCAYSRIRRRLQQICKALEMEADLDTLYRTFHDDKAEEEAA
jgi:hypothetical protein